MPLRRMRHSPAALVGGTIVLFFVFIAIFAPFLAPYDPTRGNLADSYLPPRPRALVRHQRAGPGRAVAASSSAPG